MEDAIKKIVEKQFPELQAGSHLPRFAEVVSVRENPDHGAIADEFRPYYAVDLQVLDEHGRPDTNFPVLKDVPLSLPVSGHEMGQFAFPENGAWVEMGFAYGSPNKPFVRGVLPHHRSLPKIERGEQRWQHNPASFQRVDKDGNWQTQTDRNITEDSLKRIVSALEDLEHYTQRLLNVEADDVETIGGGKTIKAMGLIQLLSGGRFDIGALHDLHATSQTNQRYRAPKTWIGSPDENVLRLLSELMQLVIDLCNILSSHTHSGVQPGGGNTGAPVQSGDISGVGSDTGGVKGRLDGIKE
jgi:hypothetical protein